MALILNIDTATELASIALCEDGKLLSTARNNEMRDHASWIHNAVADLLKDSGKDLKQLAAIAVTAGPGSYTGLRVAMASAKGLCFVLNIPLITENTLKVMAQAFLEANKNIGDQDLLVPMIDARRMEVFTAVYDVHLLELMSPIAMVLQPGTFDTLNTNGKLICFGSGSRKFQSLTPGGRYKFPQFEHSAAALGTISYQKFRDQEFADLAYVEPFYLKEFYSPPKK